MVAQAKATPHHLVIPAKAGIHRAAGSTWQARAGAVSRFRAKRHNGSRPSPGRQELLCPRQDRSLYSRVMSAPPPDDADGPALLDAVLQPHRSLSQAGFALLMGVVGLIGFANGIPFLTIGAWPVSGFCGIESAFFSLPFRPNDPAR